MQLSGFRIRVIIINAIRQSLLSSDDKVNYSPNIQSAQEYNKKINHIDSALKNMSMIKNPQIKYEGHSPKEYLFPKYPGKFFMQAEKLRDIKALKNYMPHKLHKQPKYSPDPYRDDYKQMKAETDYIKRIQQLKKKLEKQIKRYNKDKKDNENLVKSLSLSINHKSSMIKLEQICVNMRNDRDRDQGTKMQQNKQSKSLQRKRYPKSIHPMNSNTRNKTEMKRRSKTQESEVFGLKQSADLSEHQPYYSNKTERLSNSQVIKLPSIKRKESSLETRNYMHNQSQNRLSLLSQIDKLTLSANMTPKHLTKKQTDLINNNDNVETEQHSDRRRFMYNLSEKYSAKKSIKRLIGLEQRQHQTHDTQTYLKGWEIDPQTKGFNDNDSIY